MWKLECVKCGSIIVGKITNMLYENKSGCQCCIKNNKVDLLLKNKNLERHGNIINSRKKIEFLCKMCGCIFLQTPHNVTCKNRGCPKCLKVSQSKRATKRWNEFYASGKPIPPSFSGLKHHKKGWVHGHFYQSSYERNFLEYCHKNKIEFLWQSIRIPYVLDGVRRIYIPDAIINNKTIIEIKPYSILHGLFDTSEYCSYENLQIKMTTAQEYAKSNNITYEIWTEETHPWLKSGIIPLNITS